MRDFILGNRAPALLVVAVAIAASVVVSAVPQTTGKFPLPKSHPFIKTVTAETFRDEVLDPSLPVVIEFFTPKCAHCKALAPAYEETAAALQGYAKFTVMDAGSQEGAGLAQMFGVKGFPALLLFNPELHQVQGQPEGSFMKLPVAFQGSDRSAEALSKWVLSATASHHLFRVEDLEDLDDFLKHHAQLDVPKVLLFSSGNATGPMYKAASHAFRYRALFGVVDGSKAVDVVEKYAIKSFPTVVTISSSGDEESLKEDTPGDITMAKLSEFIERIALTPEKKAELQPVILDEDIKHRKREAELEKMNKALPPVVPRSVAEFKELCKERSKGICILCFVEGIETAETEMLTTAGRKMAQRSQVQSQFVIVDSNTNYELAEFFGAAANGWPAVVYVNPAKSTYQNLVGAFNERGLVNFFLEKGASGKGTKFLKKKMPAFSPPKQEGGDADSKAAANDGETESDDMAITD